MKYTMTSRILSIVFHSLIFAGFGALAIYMGFFVVPFFFSITPRYWAAYLFDGAFFLYFELAVVSTILAVLSGIGIYRSIKALLAPKDDNAVVSTLTLFIDEGWVAALFFFLQGTLLFDLTNNGGNSLTFIIVMSVILTIALLIATNIPMVKLYDGKDQKPLLQSLSFTALLSFGVIAFYGILALIGNANGTGDIVATYAYLMLSILVGAFLILTGLTLGGYLLLRKGNDKAATYLTIGALAFYGLQLVGYCITDMLLDDKSCHYNGLNNAWNGYGFPIMGIVLGGIILCAAAYLLVFTSKEKKPAAKA